MARQPPSGPRLPQFRGFTNTIRHITLVRTPLDEWSAGRRELYLTTYNKYNTDRHPWTGDIRNRKSSKRGAADPSVRTRGHWDRLKQNLLLSTTEYQKTFTAHKSIYWISAIWLGNKILLFLTHTYCPSSFILRWRHGTHNAVDTTSSLGNTN
jgi:hypothetical protein